MEINQEIKGIACTNCEATVNINAPAYASLDDVPVDAKEFLVVHDSIILAAYCETCAIDAYPSITIVSEASGDTMSAETRRVLVQRWQFLTAWDVMRSLISYKGKVIIWMTNGKRTGGELA